jgi:probable HAF family extracellular repeat protein
MTAGVRLGSATAHLQMISTLLRGKTVEFSTSARCQAVRHPSPVTSNNRGQVVGESSTGSGLTHAVLWQQDTTVDLGTLPAGVGVISQSGATAVNSRGQIVGVNNASGTVHAVLWEHDSIRDLGTGPGFQPTDINDRTQIIGYTFDASGGSRGFLVDHGAVVDLGALGGNTVVPTSINKRTQIVGYATTPAGEFHAFLWQDGVMNDLSDGGDILAFGMAINNRRQVLARTSGGSVLWQKGVVFSLPGARTAAFAMNDRAQAVGWRIDPFGTHPVLWTNKTTK